MKLKSFYKNIFFEKLFSQMKKKLFFSLKNLVTFSAQFFGGKNVFPQNICAQKGTKLCSEKKKCFLFGKKVILFLGNFLVFFSV